MKCTTSGSPEIKISVMTLKFFSSPKVITFRVEKHCIVEAHTMGSKNNCRNKDLNPVSRKLKTVAV
jgi:hypothetical protein